MNEKEVRLSFSDTLFVEVLESDQVSFSKTIHLFNSEKKLKDDEYIFDYCLSCLIEGYSSIIKTDDFKELFNCYNKNDYLANKLFDKLKQILYFKYRDYKIIVNMLSEYSKYFINDEINELKKDFDIEVNFLKRVMI